MFRRLAPGARAVLLALGLLGASAAAQAGLPTMCERVHPITAVEQDRVLRFAATVKSELERSGAGAALVARAGLDLSRFGLLYSHAGIALRDNPGGPWSVRQLYYACEESRPRLYDQGMAGFALGADMPSHGHMTLLFLPEEQDTLLAQAALDKGRALSLLGDRYSGNAYAYGTRYQNCNQWVAELLAMALGGGFGPGSVPASPVDASREALRRHAQAWLRTRDYAADPLRVPSRWTMFAGQFVPLVHVDDHPLDDIYALALHVSLPMSIEALVRRVAPGTRRVELCHDTTRIVVHRGWEALGAGCRPLPGDEIIALAP